MKYPVNPVHHGHIPQGSERQDVLIQSDDIASIPANAQATTLYNASKPCHQGL
jgi:hypothetical protein